GPFTPVGFYYRTMIRPRRAWPLYEKVLRNLAGLGRVGDTRNGRGRFDTVHRRVDVLVIGGGPAGRAAAAAVDGDVLLVHDRVGRQAGRPGGPRRRACGGSEAATRTRRGRDRRRVTPAREPFCAWPPRPAHVGPPRRRAGRLRPARRLRWAPAGLLAARAGRGADRVRTAARHLRADGTPGRSRGRRGR